MKQTTLCVPLEVRPESTDRLSELIDHLRAKHPPPGMGKSDQFKRAVPAAHFLSLSVFSTAAYDPLFVIEANFDGPELELWRQFEDALGVEKETGKPLLREMVRCCKEPMTKRAGELYRKVAGNDSEAAVAPYLVKRTVRPSVFHHGNRGMSRARILEEGELFKAAREVLDKDSFREKTAKEIREDLRDILKKDFPWLNEREPWRFPFGQRVGDALRLFLFLLVVYLGLSLPGIVAALILEPTGFWVLTAVTGATFLIAFVAYLRPLSGQGAHGAPSQEYNINPSRGRIFLLFVFGGLLAVGVLFVPIVAWTAAAFLWLCFWIASAIGTVFDIPIVRPTFDELYQSARPILIDGRWWIIVSALGLAVWLRRLERRDSSHDAPGIDQDQKREMEQREDLVVQNHMGSVVIVKPGVLRMALFRTGHLGLRLSLRVFSANGFLGSMRTVHFAHWAFVNNRSRLLFLSNFDHSWESYLDDFIEKAHQGLTLAWGSAIGFPPARFLFLDGASHGRKFKNWARYSMTVNRFWFSAYQDYSVHQIERHYRIAKQLRKRKLWWPGKADAWVRDL